MMQSRGSSASNICRDVCIRLQVLLSNISVGFSEVADQAKMERAVKSHKARTAHQLLFRPGTWMAHLCGHRRGGCSFRIHERSSQRRPQMRCIQRRGTRRRRKKPGAHGTAVFGCWLRLSSCCCGGMTIATSAMVRRT
jgi:hypothetical protein